MSVRIESKALAGMLTDLSRTATRGGYPSDGVVLYSDRGPIGEDPGEQALLIGTSYGGGGIGYCFEAASGSLEPMLWPITDVDVILNLLTKVGRNRKDHAVVIDRHGDEITVAEDPSLFGDGTSVSFTSGPLTSVSHTAWSSMDFEPDPAQAGRPIYVHGASLTPFTRVSGRRGELVRLYPHRLDGAVLVQIGHTYRGLIGVVRLDDADERPTDPDVELYVPDLPVADDERPDRLLADAAGLVITSQQATVRLLQRRLRVGESRAHLLLEQLTAREVIAPAPGSSRVHDVLVGVASRQAVSDRIAAELATYAEDDDEDDQLDLLGEDPDEAELGRAIVDVHLPEGGDGDE